MTEYTLEASVKLGIIEYALVASMDPYGSLLAEGIAECHYTGPQPVTQESPSAFTRITHLLTKLSHRYYYSRLANSH
jgi:hypothetical protein